MLLSTPSHGSRSNRLLVASVCVVASTCATLTACQPTPTAHRANDPVRVRWSRDPGSLAPLGASNQNALDGINLLYYGLLQLEPDSGQILPQLAAHMPQVRRLGSNRQLLTFDVRPEARWDDGRPVLASDVAFSLKLPFCPGLPGEEQRMSLSTLDSIRLPAGSPRQLSVVVNDASSGVVYAIGDIAIVPERVLDPTGELRAFSPVALRNPSAQAQAAMERVQARYLALNPARNPGRLSGCGPYQLSQWRTNQSLRFTRKADWWGQALVHPPQRLQARPRELDFVILPDPSTSLLALKRGEVDVYAGLTPAQLRQLPKDTARIQTYTAPSRDVLLLTFNTQRPGLTDAATRRALAHLLNVDALNQAVEQGQGLPTVGLISPADSTYARELPLREFDPAAAVAGLRAAGWQKRPQGWERGGRFLLPELRFQADNARYQTTALQLQSACAALGIELMLRPTEASMMGNIAQKGEFDLLLQSVRGNPFRFDFRGLLGRDAVGESNYARYSSPRSEQLLRELAEAKPTSQLQLLQQLQRLLYEEVPFAPLYFVPMHVAGNPALYGLHANAYKPGWLPGPVHWTAQNDLAQAARQGTSTGR